MPSVPPPNPATEPPAPLVEPQAPQAFDLPPWQPWTAPAAVAVGFAVGLVATLVLEIVVAATGGSVIHPTPAVSLLQDFVFDLSFVAAAVYFAALGRHQLRPADFGFRLVALAVGVGAFFAAGLSYYVITDVYASLVHLHGTDKLPSELGVSSSTAALIGAAVFVCVVAPIAEEFFFRGFIFGALRRMHIPLAGRDLGTFVAAIVTGILFGLAHTGSASSQYLIPLGFLGFVLCLVRWKTGSLYPCMALHSVNNSLALGVNQLHWNGLEILGLIAGALVVVGGITLPLATRPQFAIGIGRPFLNP